MTKNASSCGVKSAGPRWQMTRPALLLICSVSLTACQSAPLPTPRPLCDPTPPRLQWSQSSDGGACLSGEALGELVNYIHDLRECATAPR
ncbi:hypothetical protein [Aeromonas sobria]|uniref:hypothetical protein n=1 Tax=Aeromonas sobria TaxID=646 RepID=UPI001115EF76|nr:hypothetical protein [Aeromonas sobria]